MGLMDFARAELEFLNESGDDMDDADAERASEQSAESGRTDGLR